MKKIGFLVLGLLMFTSMAYALPAFEVSAGQDAAKVHDTLQAMYDYTGTTSGIPIYIGFGKQGLATSDTGWRVYKFTDSASGPTVKQCADGIWDNRASLTYA